MSTPPATTATPTDDAPDWRRALLDEQLETLRELAQAGLAIAKAARRRATEYTEGSPPSGEDIGGAALAYGRAMRGAGLAVALQNRLVRDFDARTAAANDDDDDREVGPGELEVVWLPPEPPRMSQRTKAEALDLVRLVAETDPPPCGPGGAGDADPSAHLDRLLADAAGRLGSFAFDGQPMGAILADICRQLGLTPDWTALAAQAWAQVEIGSGDERSPFLDPSNKNNARPPPPSGGGGPEGRRGHAAPPLLDHPFRSSA